MFHRSLGVREQGHPTGSHANPFSTHTLTHTRTHARTDLIVLQISKKTGRQAAMLRFSRERLVDRKKKHTLGRETNKKEDKGRQTWKSTRRQRSTCMTAI